MADLSAHPFAPDSAVPMELGHSDFVLRTITLGDNPRKGRGDGGGGRRPLPGGRTARAVPHRRAGQGRPGRRLRMTRLPRGSGAFGWPAILHPKGSSHIGQ